MEKSKIAEKNQKNTAPVKQKNPACSGEFFEKFYKEERIFIKKKIKVFLKSFYITSVIVFCIIFAFLGIAKTYENIRHVRFGEYRHAIEIKNGKLYFFDYEADF